jgi:organic hydroperoxide reductase OsmC/OhrA
MEISAKITNSKGRHVVTVSTAGREQTLAVAPKAAGGGSAVNGGEFLLLALATCYCNDLYREAERLGIAIDGVEVEASATFPGVGLAATDIRYGARVSSTASAKEIERLLAETDAVAEVHNTIRSGGRVVRIDA